LYARTALSFEMANKSGRLKRNANEHYIAFRSLAACPAQRRAQERRAPFMRCQPIGAPDTPPRVVDSRKIAGMLAAPPGEE
jgi:hypothetical protein